MTNNNPATPANAANPGDKGQGAQNPSDAQNPNATNTGAGAVNPAAANNQAPAGGTQEGKVTISTKEYGELQRNSARLIGFQKRASFNKPASTNPEGGEFANNPDAADEINRAKEGQQNAETKLLKEQVKNGINEILNKEEFKNLPEIAKNIIRKNPGALTNANNLEEAMLDVEDFVREEVAALPPGTTPNVPQNQDPNAAPNPTGHDTPPQPGGGGPAQTNESNLEDITNLTGKDRSSAMIRNAIKKKASNH